MIEQQDAIEQVEGKEQTEIKRRLGKISKARGNITDNGLSKVVKEEVSEFTNRVLRSWIYKELAELLLRALVLGFFCLLMFKQVIFINELIMGIAKDGWELNEFTLNLFVSVVFIEITTLIGIAIRYLFKERTTSVLDIAKETINNVSLNNMNYTHQDYKKGSK